MNIGNRYSFWVTLRSRVLNIFLFFWFCLSLFDLLLLITLLVSLSLHKDCYCRNNVSGIGSGNQVSIYLKHGRHRAQDTERRITKQTILHIKLKNCASRTPPKACEGGGPMCLRIVNRSCFLYDTHHVNHTIKTCSLMCSTVNYTVYYLYTEKTLQIPMEYSESVYRRRTDNILANIKKLKNTKGQTTIYKAYTWN